MNAYLTIYHANQHGCNSLLKLSLCGTCGAVDAELLEDSLSGQAGSRILEHWRRRCEQHNDYVR